MHLIHYKCWPRGTTTRGIFSGYNPQATCRGCQKFSRIRIRIRTRTKGGSSQSVRMYLDSKQVKLLKEPCGVTLNLPMFLSTLYGQNNKQNTVKDLFSVMDGLNYLPATLMAMTRFHLRREIYYHHNFWMDHRLEEVFRIIKIKLATPRFSQCHSYRMIIMALTNVQGPYRRINCSREALIQHLNP